MSSYILAMHNNTVLLFFFGAPFERTLVWHKLVAANSLFHGLLHGVTFYLNDLHPSGHSMQMHPKYHMGRTSFAYGMVISGTLRWCSAYYSDAAWTGACGECSMSLMTRRCDLHEQWLYTQWVSRE
jgi:hypothetical protein